MYTLCKTQNSQYKNHNSDVSLYCTSSSIKEPSLNESWLCLRYKCTCIYLIDFTYRYPTSELPGSDAGLKEWVNDLWQQKEHQLVDFYFHRTFSPQPAGAATQSIPTAISNSLLLSFLFWTGLIVITLYSLLTSFYMQVWTFVHCTIFLFLSFTSEGIHQLEASWYKNKTVYEKHWSLCVQQNYVRMVNFIYFDN